MVAGGRLRLSKRAQRRVRGLYGEYVGEQKANLLESAVMARRPDPVMQEVLTVKDLRELQRHLSLLSASHVKEFYNQAHRECCLHERGCPSARSMQQLVQAWKQLRKCR